jgi:uncharacterized phage-like protein YoqJ
MKVGISGHRPEKIPSEDWVRSALRECYQVTRASVIYQGMASGVDLWSAREAWAMKIPYVCARPWSGHKPRIADRTEYSKTLLHASSVVDVSIFQDYPGAWIYFKRNQWIVDSVEALIAVWDGSSGGTAGCVEYANNNNVPVLQINPETREIKWLNSIPQESGFVRDYL